MDPKNLINNVEDIVVFIRMKSAKFWQFPPLFFRSIPQIKFTEKLELKIINRQKEKQEKEMIFNF